MVELASLVVGDLLVLALEGVLGKRGTAPKPSRAVEEAEVDRGAPRSLDSQTNCSGARSGLR